ncbi:MAG TPA: trypsin-like peptidase domain-containing protein [Gaiellaceae bacterium]|nr:trypsin-like peptidase domain-containing protein [Gaiellaceae bacterium]
MRPNAVAAVSLVSAVVGGIVVLLLAAAFGWVGDRDQETVFAPAPAAAPPADDEPTAVSAARPLPGNGFDPARIYEERAPGVVTIFAHFGRADGQGSGFVVSEDGVILTNAHVITNAGEADTASETKAADELFVEFDDGDLVPATVVGWDVFDDVGVLRVDPGLHPVAPVPLGDSSEVAVGEPVAAIGSPFGAESSLSVGVVSATRRSIPALTSEYQLVDAIQTDAPINKGNSGGPLFDARGRVIGINAQIRSNSGVNEGVGFAVPINAARRSLEQLLEDGEVSYAYVGISTDDLTPSLARRLELKASRGALVVDVTAGSPAERSGLRGGERTVEDNGRTVTVGGDVVVEIAGRRVTGGDDLVRIIAADLRPGQLASFTILRDGRYLKVPVRLAERPTVPPRD